MRTKLESRYDCAECGKNTAPGEVHTFIFCELYKAGWNRETIVANVLYTADVLREGNPNETLGPALRRASSPSCGGFASRTGATP